MNRMILPSFLGLCFLVLAGPALSADRFVDPAGNDAADGSLQRPWRTIQKAANSALPGDTVHVRAGNYPEHVTINVSGTAQRPITFLAQRDAVVTLDPGSFYASNRSHLRLEGFRVRRTTGNRAGIEVTGKGGFVHVVGNEVSGLRSTAAAIRIGGQMHDFTIDRNHVHHNHTGNQEAIRVHERTRNFRVTRNEVSDNTNIGIDIVGWARFGKPTDGLVSHNRCHNNSTAAPWASEIYLDGPENIIVEFNVVSGSEFGFQFGCEPANDSSSGNVLRYNIAHDCSEYGLMIGGFTGGEVHHCDIHNNVFVNNHRSIGFNRNAGHDHRIFNNVLYEPNGVLFAYNGQPRNTLIDFNCYWVGRGSTPGANSVKGDPLFKNLGEHDFSIRAASPCVDAGMRLNGPQKDFLGVAVPWTHRAGVNSSDSEARPDIGAFEWRPRSD